MLFNINMFYVFKQNGVQGLSLKFEDLGITEVTKLSDWLVLIQYKHTGAFIMLSGADPGFEKGGGAGGSVASFWAYSGQFRGLFKQFDVKTGGRAPPAPPPPLYPRLALLRMYVKSVWFIPKILLSDVISHVGLLFV